MNLANVAGAAAAVALLTSTAAPADAIDFADRPAAASLNDGLIREAGATVRHGPHGTTVHARPGYPRHPYRPVVQHAARPAYHPAYRPSYPAYRPTYHPAVRPPALANPPAAAVWTRPRWYSWAPGGAVAAGVAVGFLSAAAVTAWAPPPPQPGLCWYYTQSGQQNGFWDVCP